MLNTLAAIMTPYLIAALGGLFTERAGVLNIALEGQILVGAFAAAAVAGTTGSISLGLLAAIAAGGILSYSYASISLRLHANIFVSALAVNLFASGSTQIASQILFSTRGVVQFSSFPDIKQISIPLLSSIPFLGGLFTNQSPFVYFSWFLIPAAAWLLYKTPYGLRVRAAGFQYTALYVRGVSGRRVRETAMLISGITCGISGALLAFNLGAYVPNISSGRGWIALVALFLGNKRPGGIFLVSLLFAGAEMIAQSAQGSGVLPSSLLLAFPFFITFIGMIIFSALSGSLNSKEDKS